MFSQPSVPTVLATAVDAGGYLLDVREPDEWRVGHIPGSVHIPMSELPDRLAEVPGDQSIVVICRVGGRSAQVTGWLNAQGYDAANLDGGLLDWTAAGRPLITDTGEPGVVS